MPMMAMTMDQFYQREAALVLKAFQSHRPPKEKKGKMRNGEAVSVIESSADSWKFLSIEREGRNYPFVTVPGLATAETVSGRL